MECGANFFHELNGMFLRVFVGRGLEECPVDAL
jgi:hypothetical protein